MKYRGVVCSKTDIEDFLGRLEAWKPEYPDPEDCCDGGCRVCVYDVYDRKISLYEQKKEEMESFLL